MTVVNPQSVPPVEMLAGVLRRTLHTGEGMQLVHITLRPGATVPLHRHPHEQMGMVIRGRLRMRIGNQQLQMGPGDSYHIPGGVDHDALALEEEVVVVDVFCPPREEYI